MSRPGRPPSQAPRVHPSPPGRRRARTFLISRGPAPRLGVTLIELLVAMLVAGLVGSWLFHALVQTTRRSIETERAIDRSQRRGLLRGELFQAGHRRRTLALSETEWRVFAGEDTISYACRDGGFWRGERNLAAGDTLDLCRFVPSERTSRGGEAWWVYDRDLDGKIVGDELAAVVFVEVILGYRARGPAAGDAMDTVQLRIPLAPPG